MRAKMLQTAQHGPLGQDHNWKTMFTLLHISKDPLEITEIKRLFSKRDIRVIATASMDELFDIIEEEEIDLVLCSEQVHTKSKVGFFFQMNERYNSQSIPFILIVPRNLEKAKIQLYLEMKFDNLIFRPFDEKVLVSKVCYFIERQEKGNLIRSRDFFEYLKQSKGLYALVSKNKVIRSTEQFRDFLENKAGFRLEMFSIFDFVKNNHLNGSDVNLLRFLNGLDNQVIIKNLSSGRHGKIDLRFFKGKDFGSNSFLVEIVQHSEKENLIESSNFSEEIGYLTPREKEVLKLSEQGMQLKAIANELNLSVRTVERHRASIMQKTSSNNIIEAISKIQSMCG